MSLFITRHGQTEWNVLHKVQGKADISLNEVGISQAHDTKEKLENEKIDLIICSPLKRAKETASIINSNRGVPIIYDDRISERDFGEFEGMTHDEFDFLGFWSYKRNLKYERAENIEDFFRRVYSFLDDVKEKYPDKNILLVAHGGISIPVNCYFNGICDRDELTGLVLRNCEYTKYEFNREKVKLK